MDNYKLARLVDCGGNISKRWYVVFYVKNLANGNLERKRDYSINTIEEGNEKRASTEKERRVLAAKLIKEINSLLKSGYVVEPKQAEEKPLKLITEALFFVIQKDSNLSKNSVFSYEKIVKRILDFEEFKKKKFTLCEFDFQFVQELCDWRKEKVGKTTFKHFIVHSKSLFNKLEKRKLIEKNYFLEIANTEAEVKSNVPYSETQAKVILEFLKNKYPSLWLFVITVYYTFIRIDELRNMKIGWISWERSLIRIPAEFAKGRKKGRYVSIPKNLMKIYLDLKINEMDTNLYMCGNHKPSYVASVPRYFNNLHHKSLIDLGFGGLNHTMYSWKHTGVIAAYRAGIDIKTIQRQCGHSTLQITDIYLRDLGLHQEGSAMDLMPEF
jgi:integrase